MRNPIKRVIDWFSEWRNDIYSRKHGIPLVCRVYLSKELIKNNKIIDSIKPIILNDLFEEAKRKKIKDITKVKIIIDYGDICYRGYLDINIKSYEGLNDE